MSFGISIQNTSNSVIISDTYRNFSLASSGTISNSQSLPTVSGSDMLFVRPSSSSGTLYCSSTSGSSIKTTSGSIEWVVCKESQSASSDSNGLRVFREDGTSIAFDSGRKPVNPVYIYRQAPNLVSFPSSTNLTLPALTLPSRKRYIISSSLKMLGFIDGIPSGPAYFATSAVTFNSDTSMTIAQTTFEERGPILDFTPQDFGGVLFFSFADI